MKFMENLAHDVPQVQQQGPTWLDCTLRDGGYHNNWEFPHDLVNSYLQAMVEARADRVEIGFRTLEREGYHGPTAFTSESFLQSLEIPPDLKIGVMVNAGELSDQQADLATQMGQLFPRSTKSPLSFVRIAAHLSGLPVAALAAEWLSNEGFEVGVNLMQISEASDDFLSTIGLKVSQSSVDVLYFADSLGTLTPERTAQIVRRVRERWGGPIGIHAHDNAGLALANSLSALGAGASWVDSTVFGMGRGAGNTRSEVLLGHLARDPRLTTNVELLEKVISEYFEPAHRTSRWGPSFHYALASQYGIHPTFIQQLASNASYSAEERNMAIQTLGKSDARKFSTERLNEATTWVRSFSSPKGLWNQEEMFLRKTVLLLGSGGTLDDHARAVTQLIDQIGPVVICANLGGAISSEKIDAHIACHPLRLIADANKYGEMSSPLIAPAELVPSDYRTSIENRGLLRDLGLKATEDCVAAEIGLISLPDPQVLAYSLLVALSGGARTIYLAGFDGYPDGDPRRNLEQSLIDRVLSAGFGGEVWAITPTRFNIPQSSVHGMLK